MKALVVTTRGLSNDYQSLFEMMSFLNANYEEIYLALYHKTDALKNHIESIAHIKFKQSFSYYHQLYKKVLVKHYKTYEEVYDDIDTSMIPDIDDVWMFGSAMTQMTKMKRGLGGIDFLLPRNNAMPLRSGSGQVFLTLLALKIANDKNAHYHELSLDPQEYSVTEITNEKVKPKKFTSYHGYNIENYNMKRLDCYQYALMNTCKQYPFAEKDYELTFGYTVMTKDRKNDNELVSQIVAKYQNNSKYKFFMKERKGNNTFLTKDEYMSYIVSSRFTFVIPAYDVTSFSNFRYIESIFYDCLPLVFDHCNYKPFFDSYDIDTSIINNTLVNVNTYEHALNMPEETRLELISYLKDKLFGNLLLKNS